MVNYWDKYTEMHGQQNVKKCSVDVPDDLQIIVSVDKFWKFRIEVMKF